MLDPAPPPEPAYSTYDITGLSAALRLGQAFAAVPVPTLFDLRHVDPALGVIATGVILPFAGGVVCRRAAYTAGLTHGFQIEQHQTVATLHTHPHGPPVELRTFDPSQNQPFASMIPAAFAVVDAASDLPEWGAYWPDDFRTVTWAPPITPIGGRRQAERLTMWRSLGEVQRRVRARSGPGRGDVTMLDSAVGRHLLREARAALAVGMRHAAQAYRLATEAPLLASVPAELLRDS